MENLPTDIIKENIVSRLPIESRLQMKLVSKPLKNIIGKNKTGLLFAYADVNNLEPESGAEVNLYYGDYETNLERHYSNGTLEKNDEVGQDLYNIIAYDLVDEKYVNNLSTESGAEVQLYYGDEFVSDDKRFYMYETNTKLDRVKYNLRAEDWFEYNHMVGSCNGLVCLQSYNQATKSSCVGISNPLTGEFLILPDSVGWFEHGFGYLPSTNEYKVVRCSYTELNNVWKGHMEVYTLGSQSGWREKETIPYKFYSSGLFANGAIHWIGKTNGGARIVAYDLADEKFKDIPSLPFDFLKGYDALTGRLQLGLEYRV
ncbi:F-box/kelch-repeat protein At3g06240-like [Papaver somniferum]|uniref:F-box/kelch-repeat protein At3g06240-like n=1 Tax=Papaver somniferum TaxID=3469 RepID=UPI000E704D81|nr:F-box/kelch-repeat protein At3g06240-like [Papaver somniferum]